LTGDWDLWTYELSRGIAARLPMEGEQSVALWTPDGSRLTFSSAVKGREGARALFSIDPDGSRLAEPLTLANPCEGPGAYPNAWTPDGRYLAFRCNGDTWVLPRDG
jgi:Tol biopolymer transport system component